MSKFIFGVLLVVSAGCGVKGDPLPPLDPPDLGRGRPGFSGATRDIPTEETPTTKEDSDDEKQRQRR
jgi:hypothetical protein